MKKFDTVLGTLINDSQLRSIDIVDAKLQAHVLSKVLHSVYKPKYGLSVIEAASRLKVASESNDWNEFNQFSREARDWLPDSKLLDANPRLFNDKSLDSDRDSIRLSIKTLNDIKSRAHILKNYLHILSGEPQLLDKVIGLVKSKDEGMTLRYLDPIEGRPAIGFISNRRNIEYVVEHTSNAAFEGLYHGCTALNAHYSVLMNYRNGHESEVLSYAEGDKSGQEFHDEMLSAYESISRLLV